MNPSLLSQPLSPTHARGSVPSRVRTFALALLVALFVVLLWGAMAGPAHAEEAGGSDPSSATTTSPEASPDAADDEAAVDSADAPAASATTPPPEEAAEADTAAPADTTSTVPAAIADEAVPAVAPESQEPALHAIDEIEEPSSSVMGTIVDVAPAAADRYRVTPVKTAEPAPMTVQTHASPPAFRQCNADTYPTSAGWEASCTVTVENTVGSDGSTSSRVTTTWCLAAAGVLPPEGCTSEVTTSGTLVSSVEQCNGILAGGSNVTCRVEVINNVPFGATLTGVTVNQCVGSGQGGVSPDGPPTDCDPVDSSTTGATVTQCNGSANGGGGPERVQCSVTGGASALPVTVNQCNGSTAAGSTVTCDVTYTNNIAAAAVPVPVPVGGTPVPAVTPVVPVSSPDSPPDAGRTARFTSAPPSPSSATSVTDSPSSSTSVTDSSSSTATSLAATGPSASTSRLLLVALLLLLLGSLLVTGAGQPSRR